MRRTAFLLIPALAAALATERAVHSQATAPDLVILNAKVYTVDQAFTTAQAVAIRASP